eukprot:Hpha_TRINITY_DN13357_c0_g2::TRINITY_DN13357_c0_g2_i1::g.95316::m.95316/K14442/DHX36, RHAU; ATP-dependent RNA helicase DHX36
MGSARIAIPTRLASPNKSLLTRLTGLHGAHGRHGGLLVPTPQKDFQYSQKWMVEQLDWARHATEMRPIQQQRRELPISRYRAKILAALDESPVVVLQGDTGCGKTTQVPQFILENMIAQGDGPGANIICIQPRRVSAVSVARRVADEFGEEHLGDSIGYAVRGDIMRGQYTRMLFCTTGVLLRQITSDPDLRNVSHVIVDEVHERGMLTDFLLILLKQMLHRAKESGNKVPKVVLMSATMDADRFSRYFGNCPILSVPGRMHPVESVHLEEVVSRTQYKPAMSPSYGWMDSDLSPDVSAAVRGVCNRIPTNVIDFTLVADSIIHIHRTQPHGGVLVFLPGKADLENLESRLAKSDCSEELHVLTLHGQQTPEQQCQVFKPPPGGKRKVVVATNVAETSITIDDIVYVVDSGRVKERRWNASNSLATLQDTRISEANALQRQGRAGRTSPGVCYKLWPSRVTLERHQTPEMVRSPLAELVLQSCLLGVQHPVEFLEEAMQPPPHRAIEEAITTLVSIGAVIQSPDGSICLLPLGFQLATLPIDPRLGKMLLLSCCLGVQSTVLTVAARMGARPPFYVPRDRQREASMIHKMSFGSSKSDQLAVVQAYREWVNVSGSKQEEKAFLEKFCVAPLAMKEIAALRRQLSHHLTHAGWIEDDPLSFFDDVVELDKSKVEVVRGVIAAGLWPNVARGRKVVSSWKVYERVCVGAMQEEVWMHPSSVNANNNGVDVQDNVYVFSEKVQSSRIFLRDTTQVSALSLLLFGPRSLPHPSDIKERGFVDLAKQRIAVADYGDIHEVKEDLETALLLRCMQPSRPSAAADQTWHRVKNMLEDPRAYAALLPHH